MKKLPKINRRDFLTLFGLTSAAAGCPAMASAMQASDPDKQYKTFQATCSMECLHCNLRAYVKDGVIEKIGNANAFDGKPCARGLSRIKWVYAKDRILYPMKRVGERGEAKFERISWNEALDTIAAKIKEAIQKGGSGSLRPPLEIWTVYSILLRLPSVTIWEALQEQQAPYVAQLLPPP